VPAPVAARPVPAAPAPAAPVAEPKVAEFPVAAPPSEAPVAATPVLPSRGAAEQRVPVAAGLTARARSAAEPPPVPASAPSEQSLLAQSDLTSSALSELRGLYEPTFAPVEPAPAAETTSPVAGGLVRRTPKSSEAATPTTVARARTRQRSATEVRGMLSGFRAGVERGRTADTPADETTPADTKDAT
jgi:hypothetical protein